MTLDQDDQKVIAKIVQKAIDTSVKPEFVIVNRKLDATMEMTAKNTEDIVELNERFDEVDERFDEVDTSNNRIETLVRSEVKYVDDLSRRVIKLEPKKA